MKKADRQIVHDKYGGRCAYCGCELQHDWQVDHGISKCYWKMYSDNPKAVNDMSNLYPSCRKCNHYKRSRPIDAFADLIGFRQYMLKFHLRLKALPKHTQVGRTMERIEYMQDIADRYGITPDNPFNGVFYFETLTPITSPS